VRTVGTRIDQKQMQVLHFPAGFFEDFPLGGLPDVFVALGKSADDFVLTAQAPLEPRVFGK